MKGYRLDNTLNHLQVFACCTIESRTKFKLNISLFSKRTGHIHNQVNIVNSESYHLPKCST